MRTPRPARDPHPEFGPGPYARDPRVFRNRAFPPPFRRLGGRHRQLSGDQRDRLVMHGAPRIDALRNGRAEQRRKKGSMPEPNRVHIVTAPGVRSCSVRGYSTGAAAFRNLTV